MPKAHDPREEAIRRLDERADALEARTARNVPDYGGKAMAQGTQLVAGLIGGPLVGLAFGWGFDYLAGSAPAGLIVGVLGGFAVSVFLAMRMARKMSAAAKDWPVTPVVDDDEDEDN
ncbi:MAG TPA: F0F1 ATP synthase assembly protein I [Caulobacteraceae bacterium]|nr:F0F1 ATP synthase assembly protein I [Caulobacteraceae bacterium]